jgi:branched-chain amino acid transport system substrate-binding protein
MRNFVLAMLALGLLTVALACGDDDNEGSTTTSTGTPAAQELKIGLLEDLSGVNVSGTLPDAEGVRMAVKEINDAGGVSIKGQRYNLTLVECDSKSDPSAAGACATQLVRDDTVNAVFGPQLETALPAIPVTQEAELVHFVAPTAAEKELDNPANCCLFRSTIAAEFRDPVRFAALHTLLPDMVTIGFVLPNNATGQVLKDIYCNIADTVGMQCVGSQLYEPGTQDFSGALTAFGGTGPDIIFASFIPSETSAIIRQATELGIGKSFASGGSPADAPERALGHSISAPFVALYIQAQLQYPSNQKIADFVERYKKFRGGDLPDTGADNVLHFYDSVFFWAEAIQAVGCFDCSAQVTEWLVDNNYDGVKGTMDFDATHRLKNDVDACKNVNGDIKCQTFKVP